ncbi:high-potential iron-sulfur protein [Labilithrix luteola]|uniref:High-potential iron-sulfur protein n=1 Tax=Labilithrix luteola TaxID=1391654 RepID=A0A0K1PLG6_9BACT|nr:hypothetical protein [Labilithrix luteola]AKU94367.1 high-potential iron-sulfur protein [Labilithrix luteola]
MSNDPSSRHQASRRAFLSGGLKALAVLTVLPACKRDNGPATCPDTGSLSNEDIEARKGLAYVEIATDSWRNCSMCRQYVRAPSSDQCGTCRLMKGPIHPRGTCKAWAG